MWQHFSSCNDYVYMFRVLVWPESDFVKRELLTEALCLLSVKMYKNCSLIFKNIYTSGVVRVDWTSSGSAGWDEFLRVGSRVCFPFFFPLCWCCCQSQPASEPARLCPDLLCNCKNWREADSGGYRLWSLNVYFQPLFLIVRRSWVDVHICHQLLSLRVLV